MVGSIVLIVILLFFGVFIVKVYKFNFRLILGVVEDVLGLSFVGGFVDVVYD